MAKYVANKYDSFGSNGGFKRNKYGIDSSLIVGTNMKPANNCIYPDSTYNPDITCSTFAVSNTFYFTFNVNKTGYIFQIQYRTRKRYSPSKAAAIDNSGADVWTDWCEWTNADGTTGEMPDKASDTSVYVVNSTYRAVWNKPFAHTYSEVTDYDKYHYQFRVRQYNSVANECGAWNTCAFALGFAPAITGYTITKLSTGAWRCVFETNWQRLVYGVVDNCCEPTFGKKYFSNGQDNLSVQSEVGQVSFTIPATCTSKAYYGALYFYDSRLYVLEDGVQFDRWLGITKPSTKYQGLFKALDRTEPDLPEPKNIYNSSNQQLKWYVESTDKTTTAYDDVQLSLEWLDNNNNTRTESYDMQYSSGTKTWYTIIEYPPLDVNFNVRVIPVANGEWKTYLYDYKINVPSNGLVCFDNALQGSVRLKYNQSITLNDEIAGEVIDVIGRNYPISRYGGSLSKTIKVDAQMLNSSITGGDGWKGDLSVLTSQCDWILRIPHGEKYKVFIESLDRSTESPTNNKLLDVSVSCKVVGNG